MDLGVVAGRKKRRAGCVWGRSTLPFFSFFFFKFIDMNDHAAFHEYISCPSWTIWSHPQMHYSRCDDICKRVASCWVSVCNVVAKCEWGCTLKRELKQAYLHLALYQLHQSYRTAPAQLLILLMLIGGYMILKGWQAQGRFTESRAFFSSYNRLQCRSNEYWFIPVLSSIDPYVPFHSVIHACYPVPWKQ